MLLKNEPQLMVRLNVFDPVTVSVPARCTTAESSAFVAGVTPDHDCKLADRVNVIVPEVVTGEPPTVRPVLPVAATDVTVPVPAPRAARAAAAVAAATSVLPKDVMV